MKTQISREELIQLPIKRYQGPVCLVTSTEKLGKALRDIRQEKITGLDTETRPTFHKGQFYLPSLVQIATHKAVYLFQLANRDWFDALAEVLGSPSIVKSGIGLAHDLAMLQKVFPFEARGIVDLGKAARSQGIPQSGIRNLAGCWLGFRVTKGPQTSNWAAPRLTASQITYAATDAWVCRELYLRFQELGFLKEAEDGGK